MTLTSQSLDPLTLATLLILGVAMPLFGLWDFQRLLRWTAEERPDARTRTYAGILAVEWGLVLGGLVWWQVSGRSWSALGLVPVASGWQWLAIGLGLLMVAITLWQMVVVRGSATELAKMHAQMGDLAALAPQGPAEDRLFNLVAVTAGVCEEILYRGLLLVGLAAALGVWPAIILSSVIFGLGHAYQGPVGIGKTALVGLVMALLTVYSGSLFVAILLHAVIDLTSGSLMALALRTFAGETASPVPAEVFQAE